MLNHLLVNKSQPVINSKNMTPTAHQSGLVALVPFTFSPRNRCFMFWDLKIRIRVELSNESNTNSTLFGKMLKEETKI